MGQIIEEVKLWNTPTVGAFLLYKFTYGYQKHHLTGDSPVALLHFIAIPILTSALLKEPISDKRGNLQSYVRSFEENKISDLLLSIHERTREKRHYSWQSIDIAVATGLLFWDSENGKLHPRQIKSTPIRGTSPRSSLKRDGEKAEILGKWFSQHDIATITAYLKVLL